MFPHVQQVTKVKTDDKRVGWIISIVSMATGTPPFTTMVPFESNQRNSLEGAECSTDMRTPFTYF